jgi:hypothetical protein
MHVLQAHCREARVQTDYSFENHKSQIETSHSETQRTHTQRQKNIMHAASFTQIFFACDIERQPRIYVFCLVAGRLCADSAMHVSDNEKKATIVIHTYGCKCRSGRFTWHAALLAGTDAPGCYLDFLFRRKGTCLGSAASATRFVRPSAYPRHLWPLGLRRTGIA